MNGVIKWFNEKKGFGFILGDDGQEYFVHVSKLPPNCSAPKENDKVSFNPNVTVKGRQAFDVQFVWRKNGKEEKK